MKSPVSRLKKVLRPKCRIKVIRSKSDGFPQTGPILDEVWAVLEKPERLTH